MTERAAGSEGGKGRRGAASAAPGASGPPIGASGAVIARGIGAERKDATP